MIFPKKPFGRNDGMVRYILSLSYLQVDTIKLLRVI
jgi:hypothetical protein